MERSILGFLRRRGETHVREISAALDAHPVTVDQHCFSLHRASYIRSLGTGVYQLTEAGERHLASTGGDLEVENEPDPNGRDTPETGPESDA